MDIIYNPSRDRWPELSERCVADNDAIINIVESIIDDVRSHGDVALKEITERIDGIAPTAWEVEASTIDAAAEAISSTLKSAIDTAIANISAFHKAQLPTPVTVEVMPGVKCVQRAVAIRRVGLYIPGGKAPLFSTVLMLAVPARIAGCEEVIMCTPAGKDGTIAPAILYAAKAAGVDRIFAIGGAQAIAAMTFGTASVPKVDKIFGPGNRYVTTAKQLVGGKYVSIDMPAGPSEVMVIADNSANPVYVASDLLSQAEHGEDSQAMLVALSRDVAEKSLNEVKRQLEALPRKSIADRALGNSRVVVFDSEDRRREAVEFANAYAAEHLILSVENPWEVAAQVTAAGSVFIGNYSPESAGDYASGTNHTLPTSGWAASCSGVNIDSFMRKITYQQLSPEGLGSLAQTIITMAEAEGLDAHANAVKLRIKGGIGQ